MKDKNNFDFSTYLSPFTWRYGSTQMREIFSEENKYKTWRKIWIALANTQSKAGLINEEELADLEKQQNNLDIERILEIEKETKHDLVAAIKEFAEKAKVGGGKLHLGATSMDIVDNADAIRTGQALSLIKKKLISILNQFCELIEKYADYPTLGYTHLQAAEPTSLGYRFAFYAQDLLIDLRFLKFVQDSFKSKGFKGAVGTSASYLELLAGQKVTPAKMEKEIMDELDLESIDISSQVYPRKLDYLIFSALASAGSSLAKFASDLRILQSFGFGEWMEPFSKNQVGSSAMPFKRNPLNAEKICSLARYLSHLPTIALENSIHNHLERTLDDSANKRIILPDAFLSTDEILDTAQKIIQGLEINENRIDYNLEQFAPFAATEEILVEAVKNGADRQEMHEIIRVIALKAWGRIQQGKSNPMKVLLCSDKKLTKFVKVSKIVEMIKHVAVLGDAPERSKSLVKKIKLEIKSN
ncbi:adenylosuccinate lyase [Candidatus Daviesbacteria bacterium]|nr:adenylosuccinate lyase [Candidatus Daviesbacteria bacterium]